ncbi:MAG: ABC transporter ATP-binding protein [Myxococcota bacterium]
MQWDFRQVRTEGLAKTYGSTRALHHVDATFEAGQVTVVEGPNGSGKSTLLALLALLSKPTSGRIRYGTYTAAQIGAPLRAQIGILSHAPMLYPDLTGRENLLFFAGLYGVDSIRVDQILERFAVGAYVDRPMRTWSRGQTQRIALCRALLHTPRVLLLDEPSTGLDSSSIEQLIDAVIEERNRGAICILITHHDAIAGRIADQRICLQRGQVAASVIDRHDMIDQDKEPLQRTPDSR